MEGIETPAAKFELARAHAIMQKLQPRKNRDHVQQAIATLEDLVDSNDATPQHQLLLARCLSCQFLPNQKCATRERALYILEQLVCDYPEAPEYRYELGRIYSEAQLCCISDGESMLEAQQKADKATKPFDFAYVDVPRYVELKADIFQRLAKAWQAKDETKLAADFYQKAIDKERLLYSSDKLDGQRARHGNRLAEYHILRATTLKSMDVDAAKLELEAAMQILTPLKNDSTNGEIAKSSELLTSAQQQYEQLTGV